MAAVIYGISDTTLLANGELLHYVPNSIVIKHGFGDVKTRAASAGGSNVINVVTRDLQTATAHLTFKIYPEVKDIAIILRMQEQYGANVMLLVNSPQQGYSSAISGASVMNDPSFAFGADAEITIEMQGNIAVTQT